MSFFHKKNVTKCLGHHYTIWTSDSNILLAQNFFWASQRLALISDTGAGSPKQQSTGIDMSPNSPTYNPDSAPTSLCSFSLMSDCSSYPREA